MLRLQDIIALVACLGAIALSIVSLCGGVGALDGVSLLTYSFDADQPTENSYTVHWYRVYFLRICRGTWIIDQEGTVTSSTDRYCEGKLGGYHLRYKDSFLSPDHYNSFWNYESNVGKDLINTIGPFIGIVLALLFGITTLVLLIGYLLRARRDSRAYVLAPGLASGIAYGVTAGWLYDVASSTSNSADPFFWDAPPNPRTLRKFTWIGIALMFIVLLCQVTLPWGTQRVYRKKEKGTPVELGDEYLMNNEGLTQVAAHKRRLNVWVKEDNIAGEDGRRKEYSRATTPDSAKDTSSVFTRGSMLQRGDEAQRPVSVSSVSTARGRVRGSTFQHPLAQTATLEEPPPPSTPLTRPPSVIVRESGTVGVAR